MDYRTLRLAVLMSATAVVLIILAVFVANRGASRPAAGNTSAEAGTVKEQTDGDAESEEESSEYLTVVGENFRAYGEQIGNQPKAFLYDESFFDPMRDVAVISDGDEEELTLTATALDDTIHLSVANSRGGLESGTAFQAEVTAMRTGIVKTWTDTDRDGQIDVTGQTNGSYRIRLLETQGYIVPSSPVTVTVDVPEKPVKPDKTETDISGNDGAGSGGETDEDTGRE